MLPHCTHIKCCDKLMALLLFYSVIKFLLITLTQRGSKGHTVSREIGSPARQRVVERAREKDHHCKFSIKQILMYSPGEYFEHKYS